MRTTARLGMLLAVALPFVLCLGLGVCLTSRAGAEEPAPQGAPALPLTGFDDDANFSLYVNEEPIVHSHCVWQRDGTFSSDYTIAMGGQSFESSMDIVSDKDGYWTRISMTTPQGDVEVERDGFTATITTPKEVSTVTLRPRTVLFENMSPSLISQAILAYDQAAGGKQTFPIFIVPAIVLDASLERLGTEDRMVAGDFRQFTLYRYGLPGVDVTVWVDDADRVCFGDVPAQHAAYVREGYDALWLVSSADSTVSQPAYEVEIDDEVGVPVRDGLKLATDIYRPKAAGQFPVILVRTPYKKEMNELQGMFFARRGYVYAVQDCRGRFASPGEWRPFFNEPNDGYDTIEWLAVQPWSTGKVGMIGASYLGWVQWWAASSAPPHLTTMIPNVSPPDPYFNIPYEYGAFFLFGAIWWADVLQEGATADLSGKALDDIADKKYALLLRALPVVDLDEAVLGKQNPYWRDWIAHPDNNQYWEPVSFLPRLGGIMIPVYHQSGWFDGDGIGSKLNYLGMVDAGNPRQKLTLGPWGHTATAMRMGPLETDFGPNAIVDLERSYLRWLDRWLKEKQNGIDTEPLVNVFVMGTDKWLSGDIYPLPGTEFLKLYLASNANANTSAGDGALELTAPTGQTGAYDTYVYDPADPTPDPTFYVSARDTMDQSGGEGADSLREVISVDAERANVASYYARVDSSRSDILVYDTPPMAEPLTFVGPISAELYASSSGLDTDWFVRLSQIDEEGRIFRLVHGVIRARYRMSFSQPSLLTPGEIEKYHIDMWQTGITVPRGARIRVEVASAAFPTFSRNLNTGGHNETETTFVPATQRIYHDADHPSCVILPVIKAPQFKDTIE
jgi:putative CocE/NonD family hydrolase